MVEAVLWVIKSINAESIGKILMAIGYILLYIDVRKLRSDVDKILDKRK